MKSIIWNNKYIKQVELPNKKEDLHNPQYQRNDICPIFQEDILQKAGEEKNKNDWKERDKKLLQTKC